MADYQPSAPKLQEQDLKGKIAIVTGATRGTGRAIALNLGTRGCSILGTYSTPQSAHNFDTLTHTIEDLYRSANTTPTSHHDASPNCPKFSGVAADITSLASLYTLLKSLNRDFGDQKIDILVLNARYSSHTKLGTASDVEISNALTANMHWPILLMENMVRQKLFNANARVVVLSRDWVSDAAPGSALFDATKAGLESLARAWAVELPLEVPGARVETVVVGLTDTDTAGSRLSHPAVGETLEAQKVGDVKVVRGKYPEQVADVVGLLVSEKGR